jgi:hypothetical protein
MSRFRSAKPGSRARRVKTLLLAVVVFAVSAAFFGTVSRLEPPITSPVLELLNELSLALWWEWYAVGAVVAVASVTANGRDVGRVLVLVAAGAAGLGINLGGVGLTGAPTLRLRLGWAVALVILVTTILGGAGYALGRTVRWLRERD